MIFKNRDKGTWEGIEKAAVMGTNFVAHTIVGLVFGYYCDKWFDTSPWGLLFWLIMGIIAGFRVMYLDAMKMSKTQSLNKGSAPGVPGDARDAADGAAKPTDGAPKAAGSADAGTAANSGASPERAKSAGERAGKPGDVKPGGEGHDA